MGPRATLSEPSADPKLKYSSILKYGREPSSRNQDLNMKSTIHPFQNVAERKTGSQTFKQSEMWPRAILSKPTAKHELKHSSILKCDQELNQNSNILVVSNVPESYPLGTESYTLTQTLNLPKMWLSSTLSKPSSKPELKYLSILKYGLELPSPNRGLNMNSNIQPFWKVAES
jgi:hypothetical protein